MGLVATLVTFHAHPDDECIVAGGIMRKAADEGHRVVLVVATRGEHGEVEAGFLADGEELWQRRVIETHSAATILGASRTEFLGYVDSGMMGEPTNELPGSFWTAPIEEAAERLAAILREENADVLTTYDDYGNYGHPDHIQVHRVGMRAAELAGTSRVYELTANRDHMQRGMAMFREQAQAAGIELPDTGDQGATDRGAPDQSAPDHSGEQADNPMGKPESEITLAVDVSAYVEAKRAAMRAHASQIGEQSMFLAIPDEAFRYAFGTEWGIRDGQGPGITETDVMAGLADADHHRSAPAGSSSGRSATAGANPSTPRSAGRPRPSS